MISVYLNGMNSKEFNAYCVEQFGSRPYFEWHSIDPYTKQETYYSELEDETEKTELWFDRANGETFMYATVNGEEYGYSTMPFVRSCLF